MSTPRKKAQRARSKKITRDRNKGGKIHGHHCSFCAKPKRYRKSYREKEHAKE